MRMRQTTGLGLAVLLAGPVLALGAADPALATVPALAGSPVASACGVDLGSVGHQPLALRLHGVRHRYPAGGGWSPIRLGLRNRLGRRCAGVRPVMVFGVRGGGLRHGDVRLQWRRGPGGWQQVPLRPEAGVLAGQTGPAAGLTVPADGRAAVPMRLRIGRGAPPGQWLTMAVGFEPVLLAGQSVPLPVGISNPYLFRVVRGTGRHGHHLASGRPQLAETGDTAPAAAGTAAALLLGGGTGLVLLRRRAG